MAFETLPDWYEPILTDQSAVLRPWSSDGVYAVLPSGLEIDTNGSVGFHLELVRGENPNLPPDPYGIVELDLRLLYEMDRGLDAARTVVPGARVARAAIADGWLRLQPMGEVDVAPDMRVPARLASGGIEGLTWVLKLSPNSVSLLKQALVEDVLALVARAELEIEGVAPRIDARVRFAPATLASALAPLAETTGAIARPELMAFFAKDIGDLPLEIHGSERDASPEVMAERLTDLVWCLLGTRVPAPEGSTGLHLLLANDLSTDTDEIDLSLPHATRRPLELAFDPLAIARNHAATQRVEDLVTHSEIPSFESGLHEVEVYANLPRDRRGVLAMGVDLLAPPRPPERVHPVAASLELSADRATASCTLRLAPGEVPEVTITPFAVLKDASGIERLEGSPVVAEERRVDLTADHWPLRFVHLAATDALLSHGTVSFEMTYTSEDGPVTVGFEPNALEQAASIALPVSATDAGLVTTLTSGDETIRFGPHPVADVRLDLASFPSFGPQVVQVECEFPTGVELFAIDLLEDGLPEIPDAITVLAFTPQEPIKEWRFLSQTPFGARYRYRSHAGTATAPAEWSERIAAGAPLKITAEVVS